MNKVYLVCEEYNFEGSYDTETNVFSTKENAKKYFDKIVNVELTESWIRDLVDAKESGDDYCDDELEIDEISLHAYDSRSFDSTDIYIIEKVIDEKE